MKLVARCRLDQNSICDAIFGRPRDGDLGFPPKSARLLHFLDFGQKIISHRWTCYGITTHGNIRNLDSPLPQDMPPHVPAVGVVFIAHPTPANHGRRGCRKHICLAPLALKPRTELDRPLMAPWLARIRLLHDADSVLCLFRHAAVADMQPRDKMVRPETEIHRPSDRGLDEAEDAVLRRRDIFATRALGFGLLERVGGNGAVYFRSRYACFLSG